VKSAIITVNQANDMIIQSTLAKINGHNKNVGDGIESSKVRYLRNDSSATAKSSGHKSRVGKKKSIRMY
jgi:hypothetical protein